LGAVRIRAKLDQYRETWLALPEIVKLIHSDPKDDSIIRRFALLAAALRMSIDAGLWPWSVESSDRAIGACCLRWAADKDSSITTLEEKAAEQKLREAILTEREANRLIELKLQPGGGGGSTFKPNSECAVVYNDLVAARKAGLVGGFIKNDGHKARILLYPEAFRRCSAGCGLPHDALVEYLKRAGFLEIKNEKVKGETEQYYVLTEAFLRSETTAVNA
jgi:hypothetical protein